MLVGKISVNEKILIENLKREKIGNWIKFYVNFHRNGSGFQRLLRQLMQEGNDGISCTLWPV